MVKLLLDAGANPNKETEFGETSLKSAASMGHSKVVKLLLNAGAQPNKEDEKGETPLYSAHKNGHQEVVKVLIDAGAEPRESDDFILWNCYTSMTRAVPSME